MYVDIAIHLLAQPQIELQEYEASGRGIREYAAELASRLDGISRIADTLEKDGWSLAVVQNSLEARHPQVRSMEDARERVRRLGIDPDDITDVAEWGDDGERICGD